MENSGEEGGYSPKKKLILKWVMVIFITHFFIVNLFGNNNSIESLTEYPSPAAIAKEETRLNALLQNESPLSVFEEIESLSQYIRKFGAITQPELAIRFFKHLVDLEGNSHFHLKNKIVDLGLNFSSTLVSQKAYEEAEILMDLLASSFTNLPENQHFDYQSINVFRFLNTGQEDSALFVAQESLALLAKENGLLPFEKSKYFSAFINALAQVNEQKEAWTYFEMYEAYYRKWRKAAQNQKLRNQLDWEYFSLGLHLNSNVESLSKASAFYSGIQQLHKKGAHKKIHDYNQKTIFNHLINYAINLRLNREIEVAKSVNLYGVKVSEEIGYVNGLSGFYGNLAYLGIDEEKPEDTYKYASKAIELGLLVGAEQLPNYYNILAGACIQLQQLEQAKSAVLEAARLLLNPNVVWEDLATLDFESVKNQDYVVLSFALEGLGYNLTILNDYEGGETFLPIANQFFRLGAVAYSQVVHLNKNTRELDYLYNTIHEGLMNTCLLLDNCDVSEALSITEKNKMLTQMHYLIFGEANLGSFSSSLEVQEIKKLQKDLASLNRTKKENRNAAEEQRIQANIESIERNIGDWQATFNKKNPQFKSLFNQNLNITRLVNTLREDEVLLRYFMFEDLAFLVEISKREVKSYYLGNKYHVEAEVISLIKVIKNPSSDYFPQSIRVFEKLLPNWERLHSYSKFTIISDGVLQLLPFEALISSQEKKFIAEQKEVRYSRNLTNYEFSSQLQQKTRSGFYVYSPIYGAQSALPGAMQEGQAISTKLHPILRQNASGSKYNFLKDSEYAKVLHIAAHAAVGEKESSSHIIFSDDKLHVDELYHLEIPAELVVLAACNTGLGSEEGYEAFNSLGQAFSFAGVQTLVYTLWAIPDEQSATLMTNFYQHLAKGEDKSKALTLAKQQFLQVASTNERHPYFWSGFIIQGHPGQLELENTFLHLNKWIGSILGLLLIFAALLYIRKKQSKTN